jgi:iron complex transport system substrate-binding protein
MLHRVPRIISLFPAATEIVCGLGLDAQLVGVSHACHWPSSVNGLPRVTSSRVDSTAASEAIDLQVKSLLQCGESLYGIDEMLLIELQPELIITQSQCDVCAVSAEAVEAVIARRTALAQTRLLTLNPRSLAEVLLDVERIGDAAGAGCAGREYSALLGERIAAVRVTAPAHGHGRPRVAVIEWLDPLMVAGNWTPEIVEIAGGEYGLAFTGAPSPYIAWPEIAQYAPDLLVVAPCGFDLARSRREAQQLQSLPGWGALPAVRRGQVHVVDGDAFFNCPGPRLVDTLEWLSRRIQDVLI